jgi:hypothetical protein
LVSHQLGQLLWCDACLEAQVSQLAGNPQFIPQFCQTFNPDKIFSQPSLWQPLQPFNQRRVSADWVFTAVND